jgi:hypothetical protein
VRSVFSRDGKVYGSVCDFGSFGRQDSLRHHGRAIMGPHSQEPRVDKENGAARSDNGSELEIHAGQLFPGPGLLSRTHGSTCVRSDAPVLAGLRLPSTGQNRHSRSRRE